MASEDQVNKQQDLNQLFAEYKSGISEASEFVGLLTSRTADLTDQYKDLARISKQYGENEKQTVSALSQSAKLARSLQAPYDSIKAATKDLEKSAKARVQLANSLAAAEGKLSNSQEKSLTKLIQKREKLSKLQAFEDQIGARLTEKQKQKVDAVEDERLAKERAAKEVLALENAGFSKNDETYKRAKAAKELAENSYRTSRASLSVDEEKYQRARKLTASTKDQTEELEAQLDPQAKMVLALREALGLHDKTIEYQEEELRRLENIEKAQSYYNLTLGLTADILDKVGAGRLKEAFGLQAGSEAAADAAKRLTDNGKKSLGVFGKLRVLFAGLGGALSAAFSNLMPGALIVKGVTQMISYFKTGDQLLKEMSGEVMDIAMGLGISTKNAKELLETNKELAYSVGVMPEILAKQMVELNQAFGTTQKFSEGTTAAFAKLVNLQGYSTEEAANLVKISKLQGEEVSNQVDQYQAEIIALNAVNNTAISVKQVTQDIASASASTVLTLRGQGKSLGDAAFQAARLGLSMEKLEGMSSSLLDFESSIAKEMEAELLIGRDLNLDRAREAALRGDMAGVAAALANEMGSAAEFGNLNVLQQEALAEALGMNRDTLAESLKTQELLANTNFDSIDSASKSFQDLLDKGLSVEQARIQFIKSGGTEALAASISYEKQEEIRQRNMEDAQAKMAAGFLNVVKSFREIKKEIVELGSEFYSIFLNENDGFINRLGLGVADVKGSFVDMAKGPIMAIGHGINKFVNRLIDFYKKYGPDLKTLFLNISDLIMTSTQFVVELVTEFAGLNDELDNADGKFKLGKNTLSGWSESIKGAIDYIRNLDVKAISDSIHDSISQVMNVIKDPTLQKFLRAIGIGATIKATYDFMLGKTPLTPMFVKVVDGASSLMTGAKNAFTGANGGFSGGTSLGRMGSRVAMGLNSNMGRPVDAMGRTLVQQGGRMRVAAGQAGAGQFASVAGRTATTGTALAGLGAAAGGLAAAGFVAKGAYDVAQLDARSTSGESAEAIGGLGGAAGGAALGAAIGTMILPGVGTAIGAGIGAGVGYFGGRAVGAMDEFEDDLDKARKRRERALKVASILEAERRVRDDAAREASINKVYKTFKDIANVDIASSFEGAIDKDKLEKIAKELFASGKLSSKEFQEVINGKLSAAEVVKIAADRANVQALQVSETKQRFVQDAGEIAVNKIAQEQNLNQEILESQSNMLKLLRDEEGEKVGLDIIKQLDLFGEAQSTFASTAAQLEFDRNKQMVYRLNEDSQYASGSEQAKVDVAIRELITSAGDLTNLFTGTQDEVDTKIREFQNIVIGDVGGIAMNPNTGLPTDKMVQSLLLSIGDVMGKYEEEMKASLDTRGAEAKIQAEKDIKEFDKVQQNYVDLFSRYNFDNEIDQSAEKAQEFLEKLSEIVSFDQNLSIPSLNNKTILDVIGETPEGLNQTDFLSFLAFQSSQTKSVNVSDLESINDGAAISNNGPFTITDKFGNAAITHPNDKLVVSPNVSYVNDGISGKGGSVFPVSEKFGALDVQVGKEGVMVQKVNDGVIGATPYYSTASGTTSSTRIKDMDTISQLGVSGVTKENFRGLFETPYISPEDGGFKSLLEKAIKGKPLSSFQPSTTSPPSPDYFAAEGFGGTKTKEISDEGTTSFYPKTVKTLKASGNGLLALYRAIEQITSNKLPSTISIGFKQDRTSAFEEYDGETINDLTRPFNAIENSLLYSSVLPNEKGKVTGLPVTISALRNLGPLKLTENSLKSTIANFIPKEMDNSMGGYEKHNLGPYDFTEIKNVINNMPLVPKGQARNVSENALHSSRKEIKDAFIPQYLKKVFTFLSNRKGEFFAENFVNKLNPFIGPFQDSYSDLWENKATAPGLPTPSPKMSEASGQYKEGGIQRIEDGLIEDIWNNVSEAINPREMIKKVIQMVIKQVKNLVELAKGLTSGPGVKNITRKTLKNIPFIGRLTDLGMLGYDLNQISEEFKFTPSQLYKEIGLKLFGSMGGILGSVGGGALGAVLAGALTGASGGVASPLIPYITPLASTAGGMLGNMLGTKLGEILDPEFTSEMGKFTYNKILNPTQSVADGSALASKGPFTITDKFGATAVTAKGDGVVVSPNISYVEDGITNATAPGISQNTTVIENDNSELKQELAEMKQLMSKLIETIPTLASRPISIELDGNKVGQSLGQNSYRVN